MIIRKYEEKDISKMIEIWNEVVEDGIAFPQEDLLDDVSGREFFEFIRIMSVDVDIFVMQVMQ